VAPSVPITFNPKSDQQLREIEGENGLQDSVIVKAKWIKPIERRRAGQTHAYAILQVTSVDAANLVIRDGLTIRGVSVRPSKQNRNLHNA